MDGWMGTIQGSDAHIHIHIHVHIHVHVHVPNRCVDENRGRREWTSSKVQNSNQYSSNSPLLYDKETRGSHKQTQWEGGDGRGIY